MAIVGEVSRILHYKEDSGWCVFLLRQEDGSFSNVVGVFPDLSEASSLKIEGKWLIHPKFGKQFKATGFTLRIPTSDYGIRKYLEWALPQIGPQRAAGLVREFGEDTFQILDNECERISIVPGITEERAEEIEEAWKEGEPRRRAYIYLARFGLTKTMVERVIEYFKEHTIDVVEDDPYVLIEVSGLSFAKVDQMALSMGIGPNSPARRRAALTYLIRTFSRAGHVYQTIRGICRGIKALQMPQLDRSAWSEEEVQKHLDTLSESGFIVQEEERVYLSNLYYCEISVAHALLNMQGAPVGARHVLRLMKSGNLSKAGQASQDRAEHTIQKNTRQEQLREMFEQDSATWFDDPPASFRTEGKDELDAVLEAMDRAGTSGELVQENSTDFGEHSRQFRDAPPGRLFKDEDIEEFLVDYQMTYGIEFSGDQKKAVHLANQNRIFLLTGLPGTGKTTVLKAVLGLYRMASLNVQLCAPTGKAAKRLSQVAGRSASTIHRYLRGFGEYWCHNASNPAPDHAVVVDEFSMVDIRLMYRLMDALPPDKYLAMVGDPGQLPSVGPGSVLRDIIESGKIPRVHLREIFRQTGTSMIVHNAHKIHHGNGIIENDSSDFLCYWRDGVSPSLEFLKHICKTFKKRDISFQVISPKRNDSVGTIALNEILKPILNPGSLYNPYVEWGDRKFHLSDRVIMTRNDYQKKVFNGDIGEVVHADPTTRALSVVFEDNDLGEFIDDSSGEASESLVDFFADTEEERSRRVKFQGEDLSNLELAYALTVHKSQGSEWDTVVLLMLGSHGRMLRRRLFYTAVTRAKKRLVVVGENKAVLKAISNNTDDDRNTTLKEFLQEPLAHLTERLHAHHANSLPPRCGVAAQA